MAKESKNKCGMGVPPMSSSVYAARKEAEETHGQALGAPYGDTHTTHDAHATTRRGFIKTGVGLVICGAVASAIGLRSRPRTLWQIDPSKCIQCGNCATCCVLGPSAVKCVHSFALCGYCEKCFAYFDPATGEPTTAAENQLCPMRAIERTWIEDPYYQYRINESMCIGCGKCVKGCSTSGNGSLYLQVRHDRCVNCNQCSIALACPSGAFKRVRADRPYLLKDGSQS